MLLWNSSAPPRVAARTAVCEQVEGQECALGALPLVTCSQALEKEAESGGAMDQYEIEGPDRAELLADLAEFQLATVRAVPNWTAGGLQLLHREGP